MTENEKRIKHAQISRKCLLAAADFIGLCGAGVFAYYLAVGNFQGLPWGIVCLVSGIQVLVLFLTRLYHVRLCDSSIDLAFRVSLGVLPVWLCLLMLSIAFYGGSSSFVRVSFLYSGMSLAIILGIRLIYRLVFQKLLQHQMNGQPKAIVYGAGDTGTTIARMAQKKKFKYSIVGFVDDKPELNNEIVMGLPVMGDIDDLSRIMDKEEVDALVIAITAISSEKMQKAVAIAKEHNVDVKVVPNLFEKGRKPGDVSIRDIDYADLLGRSLNTIKRDEIEHMVADRVILVTGAGGSIGSEICRQLVSFVPKKLYLLDIDESELHDLCLRLLNYRAEWSDRVYPILCDIRDREKIRRIFQQCKPDIVFHAAAVKHVPMSELYPEEAIRTNIIGSYNVLSSAKEVETSKVVVISTDKAVNPTNVMGATKRVVEMMASALSCDKTQMCAVRFGNVIGSRGSMLPLFLEEIKAGVPITVTDKNIIRYFMAIPEAVGLVFQAAVLANGGDVMVLDMGEPVNIYNFAQKLIDIFGDERSSIIVTGLRPGEKLYEELLANKDTTIPTANTKIFQARVTSSIDPDGLGGRIDSMMKKSVSEQLDSLHKLVPEWKSPEAK
ncbi:MAG: nucleoside-diphosphate sugar epimerase/dehydratase [Sphaerochaetaceae bacterium]|jgi:FlaA1/EpsC-like NDP-sugar epimerase|nr:nucleoside-diphosphate sugar epimerase/dehydratase [Sphaerochaetaceae bacterium]